MDLTHRRTVEALGPPLSTDPRLVALAAWGRRLADLGVSPGASGNLSCSSPDGFLITATGVPLGEIEPEHWVEVTDVVATPDGGLRVDSRGLYQPSRDSAVHAATYRARPDATSLFHLHPDYLHTLTDDLAVPTTPVHRRAGTVESVREIERFLAAHPDVGYFVLLDHGIVSIGGTVDEAGQRVVDRHHAVTDLVG